MELPVRLRCGASYRRWNGDGWLRVAKDGVSYEFSSLSRLVYPFPTGSMHVRPPVVVVRARLLPPGLNSALVLRGEQFSIRVLTWWGVRRRVEASLAAANVATVELRTWVSLGTRLALSESPSAIRRGRLGSIARVTLGVLTLLAVAGVILYLTVDAAAIPTFLPGHVPGSTKHQIAFAVSCMILATGSILTTFATERRSSTRGRPPG